MGIPVTDFLKKIIHHKAFNINSWKLFILYFLKLIVTKPFRVMEKVKYGKRIERIKPKEQLLFIIGHWRSGTTYTHNLLSQDPRFFYQSRYQNPNVFFCSEKAAL
ncbi:MAG: sulfotransferase [Candidatus Aminicenantaceae bacterium]